MTNMICDECETVAHCMKNGCVPKTTKRDDALKLALEALEDLYDEQNAAPLWKRQEHWKAAMEKAEAAMPALREALQSRSDVEQQPATATYTCGVCGVSMQMEKHGQQPAGEPVAVMTVLHLKDRTEIGYGPYSAGYDLPIGEYKLYTRPQPSAQWVGLTDEQKLSLEIHGGKSDVMLAELVEGWLKEKNT